MFDDLEEESRQRKERISKLVDGLQTRGPPVKEAAKVAAPPRRDHPLRAERKVAEDEPPAPSTRPSRIAVQQQQQHQQRAQTAAPKQTLPPAPRSPVKERVSSLLTQRGIEERAKERRERAAALQQAAESRVRKQKHDEKTKATSKLLEEETRLLQYQMEHKLQLESLKEEARRKEGLEHETREKRQRAVAFHQKQLLIRCGFAPMLHLVEMSRNNWMAAVNFADDVLLQQAWVAFYGYCANKKRDRVRKEYRQASLAVSHYKHKLVGSVFRRWSLHKKMLRAKAKAVTGHFSRFTANRRAWRAWRDALEKSRRQTVAKLRAAKPRGDLCVLKHCFRRWSEFLRERLLEVEVDARVDFKWNVVRGWLDA